MGALGLEISVAGFEQHRCSGAGRRGSSSLPDLASINDVCLLAAEEAANHVLSCVHPTIVSEKRRSDIVDYIQRLIRSNINCEVIPYGSVPLKTYLPEGDIDFTVFGGSVSDESLAKDVHSLILREQRNEDAEYQIMDSQFIGAADVKLVKCIVQDVVIDISFNQMGGISTLCFLELVDRIFGRNHLFKRSVILVKAWCYYESRLLGSNHGLISTYALEVLVLYILHQFHSSLRGPLSVLYKFLSYYSQFDWDNYCISLKGPVCKSSLPDIVVKTESFSGVLNLSERFPDNCIEMFSVSSRMPEGKQKFQTKFLNIIDPLNPTNNLGRSVQQGSFYRIRSAFELGARKLSRLLSQPTDKVSDELSKFFKSTLQKQQMEYGSSIHHLTPKSWNGSPKDESVKSSNSEHFALDHVDTLYSAPRMAELTSAGVPRALHPLADLTGDYTNHICCLLNAQLCYSLPSHLRGNLNQGRGRQAMPNSPISPRMASYAVPVEPNRDLTACPLQPVPFQRSNRPQRTRGTGTYFPRAVKSSSIFSS